jgi:hypothetical protein
LNWQTLAQRLRGLANEQQLGNWWFIFDINCLVDSTHTHYLGYSAVRNGNMTTFDKRENAFEERFAHDAELQFKITARRNKLVGQWAAEKMGLTPEETTAYATSVVQADFEESGVEDVVRKLLGDLTSAGVDVDDATIRAALEDKMVEARRQFIEPA